MFVDSDRLFILADIPGLIEGASEGVGLGHEFLRHVERAGILIHLVEPEPMDQTDPVENYQSIRHELIEYSQPLAERPELIAITKCELPSARSAHERLSELSDQPIHLISAVTGEGLQKLLEAVDRLLPKTTDFDGVLSTESESRPKRIPPHKRGPTSTLSDDVQARDYVHEDEQS